MAWLPAGPRSFCAVRTYWNGARGGVGRGLRWCSVGRETLVAPEDGMTRYPSMRSAHGLLRCCDWLGTVSFAASGAIMAGHAGMDSLGCTIVGGITAVGGGTVRDLIIGQLPVFWIAEVEYLWLVLATTAATFIGFDCVPRESIWGEKGVILYATDCIGLGAFAVIGAQNAIRLKLPSIVCVVCGMITATFGGVMRDVLCQKPARIIYSHSEIYAVTALSGAICYVGMRQLRFSPAVRIITGVLSAVVMRHSATKYGIKLPVASWHEKGKEQDNKVAFKMEVKKGDGKK